MPVLTAATPRGTKQYPHLSYSWLLPPGMEHRSASALIGSRAALPTQLLLKWESPEKPPRKPQKIQAPTCQPVCSHCFTVSRRVESTSSADIFFFNKALFGKKYQNLSITCSSILPIRLGTASSHPSPPSSSPQSPKIVFNIQQ